MRSAVDLESGPWACTPEPISPPAEFVSNVPGMAPPRQDPSAFAEPLDPVAEMRRVLRERTDAWNLSERDRFVRPPGGWLAHPGTLMARLGDVLGRALRSASPAHRDDNDDTWAC